MNNIDSTKTGQVLYQITEEDVQYEAILHLGRRLTEDEITRTKKLLEFGIGESIGIIYRTIFDEGIEV